VQAQPSDYRRGVRSIPAQHRPPACAGVAPNAGYRDHTPIPAFIHIGWRQERSAVGLMSLDGTFPQRCRLARTDRNRGTRAAVLFAIRTVDLATRALPEGAGNVAIISLVDDRGDLAGGRRHYWCFGERKGG
jgi:hypothetical protein